MVRKNLECDLWSIEQEISKNVYQAIKYSTKEDNMRIIDLAFKWAISNNRKKVTCIHRKLRHKIFDGLLVDNFKKVSKNYPGTEFQDMHVEEVALRLIQNPKDLDVIVTTSLYGAIITAIGAGMTGGPNLSAATNYGKDCMLFEEALS